MECKGAGVDRHLATQCSPAWMAAANPMTQQLCCWSSNHVRRGGAHERCPQNAATLDCAKANLKSFAFVGLVERMNQSVALMKHTLAMRLGGTQKGSLRLNSGQCEGCRSLCSGFACGSASLYPPVEFVSCA
jgi:hypothetical protein